MKNQNYYRVLTYLFAAGTLIGIVFAVWAVSMLPEQVNPWGRTAEQIADFLESKPVGAVIVSVGDTSLPYVKTDSGAWAKGDGHSPTEAYFLASNIVRVRPEQENHPIYYVVYQPGETRVGLPK